MATNGPGKRIPKSLGTDAKLFGSYTLTDVGVAVGPAVIVVLTLQVLVPPGMVVYGFRVQALTLPLAGMAGLLGATLVYLTPSYISSLNWLEMGLGFYRQDRALDHRQASEQTRFSRVHPVEGAIERTDGAIVGMVRVDPPSLALATDGEWRSMAAAFTDFCNTIVEFPIQLYSTTQAFPVEAYLERYIARLDDPDVKANPRLAALIEQYIEWYSTDLESRRMTIRDHYVIVTVSPTEVKFDRESLLQKLAHLPVIGWIIQARFAPGRAAEREAMFDALAERLRRVETGIRDLDGCQASRVTPAEAARLLAEFWTGRPQEDGTLDRVLRTRPIIGGPR